MNSAKRLWKDIRRSLGLLLALIIVVSGVITIPVGAAETFKIVDTGKMFGMGYVPEVTDDYGSEPEFVFQTCETVIIENAGDVDMTLAPVLNVTVYVTINETEYEVIQYTSNPAYNNSWHEFGIEELDNGAYSAWMAPRYVDEAGNEISSEVYTYCPYYGGTSLSKYCNDALYYGFSEEIISYLNTQGITDKSEIVEYLTSEALSRQCTIKYTLTDSNNTIEEYEQTGGSFYVWQVDAYQPPMLYAMGKRISYNRIEDLAELHESNEFNHLKMYKSNMYVDADNLTVHGDALSIPNINNSGLFELNSVYVNDSNLYNDGYSANRVVNGYNLLDYILPEPVDTEEKAVDEFINILTGKMFTVDDFETEKKYYSYYSNYNYVNNWYGHSYMLGENLITVDAYNDYEYYAEDSNTEMYPMCIIKSSSMSFVDAYNSGSYDDTYFMWQSSVMPEVSINDLDYDDVNSLKGYFRFLYEGFGSYETVYSIMAGDEKVLECNLYDMAELLSLIANALYDEECARISELTDDYTYYDWNTENEIVLNSITDVVPVKTVLENEYMQAYQFSDVRVNNSYYYDADEIEGVLEGIGLSKDGLKIWLDDSSVYIPFDSNQEQYKAAFIDTMVETYGEEAYTAFEKYVSDNFVTHDNYIVSITEEDSSQKNTEIDVYADELEIPLTFFDVSALGEENVISQLWYAGNEKNYLLPIPGTIIDEVILYYGEYINVDYTMSSLSDYGNTDVDFGKVYELKYDGLWNNKFGTIIFAKVPDRIAAQEEILSNAAQYEITWDIPADNGAEIIGYQIAVVPRSNARSTEPSDDQYITVGDTAGYYTDLGDNYTITYSTDTNSYMVETNGKSVDVYVRAVNVIGAAKSQKISITNPYEISISGPASVKAGNSGNYDTTDITGDNVEASCTYSVQGNPSGVSISADGNLTIDSDCTLTEVTIVVTGKTETNYAGMQDSMTVVIEAADVEPDTDTNPDSNPDSNPEQNPNTNPDAGSNVASAGAVFAVLSVMAMAAIIAINRRKMYN